MMYELVKYVRRVKYIANFNSKLKILAEKIQPAVMDPSSNS